MNTPFSLLVTGFLSFFLLETQALYALDLTSWATPSKLVQTMLPASLQKMAKTVLKPVSQSSASAEFLTRFRALDQKDAQDLLKKTPSDVQVQAMREILLETYLYHQHDWQELFQKTQKIAEQLQLAGPQNQKLYQDFQAFLQSPQRFSESKDGFETLLWHTHLTLSAFYAFDLATFIKQASAMREGSQKLLLPAAHMEALLLENLLYYGFLILDNGVNRKFGEYSIWSDVFYIPQKPIASQINKLPPESIERIQNQLQALQSAQETGSDFLIYRAFYIYTLYFEPFLELSKTDSEPFHKNLHPVFLNDFFLHPAAALIQYSPITLHLSAKMIFHTQKSKRQIAFQKWREAKAGNRSLSFQKQLLDCLAYFESQGNSFFPLYLHFQLAQNYADGDSSSTARAQLHFEKALAWADKINRPQFKVKIFLQLAQLAERSVNNSTQVLNYCNQALALLKGEAPIKQDLLHIKAEALVNLKQFSEAKATYRLLLNDNKYKVQAMIALYRLEDDKLIADLPRYFSQLEATEKREIMSFLIENAKMPVNASQKKQSIQLLSAFVLQGTEAEYDEPLSIYREVSEFLDAQADEKTFQPNAKTFLLTERVLKWLEKHPNPQYWPRLQVLLQNSALDKEKRQRAMALLRKLDASEADKALRSLLLNAPETIDDNDLFEYAGSGSQLGWKVNLNLQPHEWWQIYPRLSYSLDKKLIDEIIIYWLRTHPDQAFENVSKNPERKNIIPLLDLLFQALPQEEVNRKLIQYFSEQPVALQTQLLYDLHQSTKPFQLKSFYLSLLDNSQHRSFALLGLTDELEKPEVYPILKETLKEQKEWPNGFAAIGYSKNLKLSPLLQPFLTHPNREKAEKALAILIKMEVPELETYVEKLSQEREPFDQSPVFEALRFGKNEALKLKIGLRLTASQSPRNRKAGNQLLQTLQDKESLLTVLSKYPHLFPVITRGLGHALIGPQHSPELLAGLKSIQPDQQWPVFEPVLRSETYIHPSILAYLISRFSEFSEEKQKSILWVLSRFGTPPTIPFLLTQLEHPSADIQLLSLKALQALKYKGTDKRIPPFLIHKNPEFVKVASALQAPDENALKHLFLKTLALQKGCDTNQALAWKEEIKRVSVPQAQYLWGLVLKRNSDCLTSLFDFQTNEKWDRFDGPTVRKLHQLGRKDILQAYLKLLNEQVNRSLSVEELVDILWDNHLITLINQNKYKEGLPLLIKILDDPKLKPDENLRGNVFRGCLVVLSKIDQTIYLEYAEKLLKSANTLKRQGAAQAIIEVGSVQFLNQLRSAIQADDKAIIKGLLTELLPDQTDDHDQNDLEDTLRFKALATDFSKPEFIQKYPEVQFIIDIIQDQETKLTPASKKSPNPNNELDWQNYLKTVSVEDIPELYQLWKAGKLNTLTFLNSIETIKNKKVLPILEEIIVQKNSHEIEHRIASAIQGQPEISSRLKEWLIALWQKSILEKKSATQELTQTLLEAFQVAPQDLEKNSPVLAKTKIQMDFALQLAVIRKDKEAVLTRITNRLKHPDSSPPERLIALSLARETLPPERLLPLLIEFMPVAQTEFSPNDWDHLPFKLDDFYNWLAEAYLQLEAPHQAQAYQFLALLNQ